jgi:hypothetical protein
MRQEEGQFVVGEGVLAGPEQLVPLGSSRSPEMIARSGQTISQAGFSPTSM